ncbi:MAG: hypothetical protein V3T23_02930 [Nitrososphaerales archaeon]
MKPKVYANIIECWQDLIRDLDLDLPASLSLEERYIFMLGIEAGRREEKGLWTMPEDMKLRPH